MKKLISILLVAIMLVSMSAVSMMTTFAAATTVKADDSQAFSAKVGDIIQYTYSLNYPDKPISSIQATTHYSDNLKLMIEVDEWGDNKVSAIFPKLLGSVVYNFTRPQEILFNYSNVDGKRFTSGNGVVITLKFIVTAEGAASINSVIHYLADSTPGEDNRLIDADVVNPKYTFTLSGTAEKIGTASLYGDVDSNGKVNVQDASYIQKFAAKQNVVNFNEAAADVDGNSKVNVQDASYAQKYAAKQTLPSSINAGKWIAPENTYFPVA